MYLDWFYSVARFFFFFLSYGRRFWTGVVTLSKMAMRLKLLTNLTGVGKEKHVCWVLFYGCGMFRKGLVGASLHVLSV